MGKGGSPSCTRPWPSLRRLVMAGGKRLRPAFCYWGFRGAGGDADDPRIVRAGAALELLHTSALIHDDVIDCSASRRGAGGHPRRVRPPPCRRGLAGRQRPLRRGHRHPPRRPGLRLRRHAPGRRARRGPGRVRRAAPRGQRGPATWIWSDRPAGTPPSTSARRIGRYKSAKYTIERPAASRRRHRRPRRLGPALRTAERLRPAARRGLSAEGRPARSLRGSGPSPASPREATSARANPPFSTPCPASTPRARRPACIIDRFGAPDLSDGEVAAIQTVFEDTGARAEVEAMVDALVTEAAGGRRPAAHQRARPPPPWAPWPISSPAGTSEIPGQREVTGACLNNRCREE